MVGQLLKILWRPVFVRALGTFIAIGLPAAIVFAPNGMRADDLVRAMDRSLPLRVALWAGWLLLGLPASTVAFTAPGTTTFRAMAQTRHRSIQATIAVLLLHLVAQLPWLILFGRGSGVLAGVSAAATAIAIDASFVGRTWVIGLLGFVAVLIDVPALGIALAPLAVHAAWRRGPEGPARARIWTRPTNAVVALVSSHLLRLVRLERSRLTIATMIAAIGGAGLLTLRSAPSERPLARALEIMALPLTAAAAIHVAPLLESERQLHALLQSLRVRRLVVVAAFLIALATPVTALAATSALAPWVAPVKLTTGLSGWAITLSALVGVWGRVHQRTKARSPAVFAVGVILVAIFGIAFAAAVGP